MNVLIAPDKFKGSLSARLVGEAIARGITSINQNIKCNIHPLADGGDGTMSIIKEALGLQTFELDTIDPLGRAIKAKYYSDGETAFIELAEASGIALLTKRELNPLITTTIGTGLLLKDAISKKHKNIVIGLGGSCTNDAGLGIAHVLGYKFYDSANEELVPCGGKLLDIVRIEAPTKFPKVSIKILCDVRNPLYGPEGAAYVFARQKGATEKEIEILDRGLRHIAQLVKESNGSEIGLMSGGGAAGGVAAGLIGLFDGEMLEGFHYLAQLTELEKAISQSDLVITGEGKLDAQSLDGKVIDGVSQLCKKHNVPLIAAVGISDLNPNEWIKANIHYVYTIMDLAKNQQEAIEKVSNYLRLIGQRIAKDIL